MGKKSTPAPPDYTGLAVQQATQQNDLLDKQTSANRANQYTPWGSQTWSSTAGTDPTTGKPTTQWSQQTTLDPRVQQSLDSQLDIQQQQSQIAQGLLGRARSEFGTPMNFGSLNQWGQAPQQQSLWGTTSPYGQGPQQTTYAGGQGPQQYTWDTSRDSTPQLQQGLNFGGTQNVQGADANRQKAEDAIYRSSTSRLDPQWDKRSSQMEAQLANKGITSGSQAYTDAMADFGRQRTDAYQQAQMGAITGAGAEAQRDQGMDMSLRQQQVNEIGQQGQFANQAAGQGFGFGQQARGQQLAAQQQAYDQGMGGFNFGLQQQQQAFGQQQATSGYDLQRQQQAFGQQQAAGAQNYSQGMQGAQYANTLRQQQLAEAIQQRGFSLNEMQALMNGQQVNMPTFGNYSSAGVGQAADLTGAANMGYNAQMDASNAKQASSGQAMGAVGSMASTAAIML